MPAQQFLRLAARHKCSTLQLRNQLRKLAIPKDGSPDNLLDRNLLFPPSMIQNCLTFESVGRIVNCSCAVCGPVVDSEPFNDARLINEIRNEPGNLVLLAILIHMGAGFATRLLHFHGLGKGNDFDIWAVFERNANLKSTLFQNLSDLSGSRHPLSTDELATNFCTIFAETKQLFKPPSFQEGEIFREIPPNANLPFLEETELRGRESSWARWYRFRIHKEFCSPGLSVRFHFDSVDPFEANKTSFDRN